MDMHLLKDLQQRVEQLEKGCPTVLDTHQIHDLLQRHLGEELAIAAGGHFLTLDGSTGRLVVELLRLANIGAAAELVRDSNGRHAPLSEALHIASVTWPQETP